MAMVLPLIATMAVAARIYARFQRGLKLAIDDWLVMFALASLLEYHKHVFQTMTDFNKYSTGARSQVLSSGRCIHRDTCHVHGYAHAYADIFLGYFGHHLSDVSPPHSYW